MRPLLLLTTILIALYAYLCQKSKESKGLPKPLRDVEPEPEDWQGWA